ncbi:MULTISPECIES: transposase [Enterococcus]|nr:MULTISPECIES: transposase [Enterococcus]MCO5425003.1 transposase [Enterococcus faecalis]MCO5500527.1 transposase [Enterococcus faecalis]MCU9781641.1 transposase [Enterococcus faecalis]MDQ8652857.1 hypothetical protein [Enterococcus sp. FR068]MDV3015706.1 hypothetical protein [Enterococcus faecalis]
MYAPFVSLVNKYFPNA